MAKLYNTIYVANPHDKERLKLFEGQDIKVLSADTTFEKWRDQPDDDGIWDWEEL